MAGERRLRDANFQYRTLTAGLLIAFFIFITHLMIYPGTHRQSPQQRAVLTPPQQQQPSVNLKEVVRPPSPLVPPPTPTPQEPRSNDAVLDVKFIEENLYTLDQKDKQLIQYTRIRHLTPPSKLPYSFEGQGDFKDEFSAWVADFFGNKRDGIFIEAGAHEGEKMSHTLYLEKELGWTGLLVECNPTLVPYLKSHHRRAWVASVCLAPTTNPGVLNFSNPTNFTFSGTFRKPWNVTTKWTFFDVDTMPFYTILAAFGWKEVDYFSFDIEGSELAVLKTFPFDEIIFKVLVVEVMFYTEEEKKELDQLLQSNGYHFVKDMPKKKDKVYVHNSVKHLIKN